MPKDFPRSRRIAEQIQRELSDIIRLDLKDPRVTGMITITDVEVTQDNAHAKVFFTQLGDSARAKETEKALQHAAGFLRSELAHRLKLRTVPHLKFEYDASIERGMRLTRLIDEAVAGDSSRSKDQ
ncbi:MAG: 30S ribosome-binding factor RbfA [Betaproteobacteria bacterium]|nr:30S ribosome-binding factor RbfA [Betaproteobacteria bacterium]